MSANKRFWRGAFSREAFKFSLYVTLPVLAGTIYANPDMMKKLVYQYHFIEYPKEEGTEVIHEFIQEMKDKERQRLEKERAERLARQSKQQQQ